MENPVVTVIATLTPPGKAAIATIAVRGPLAWTIARELFQPHQDKLPELPLMGRCRFGKLGGDEVILAVKDGLPTPALEIHCHGGVEVVRLIEELFTQRGVQRVPWQAFVGASAPLQELLAQASTARTAGILLDQWQGAWDGSVRAFDQGDGAEKARRFQRLNELIPLGQHLVTPWKVVIAGAPNVGKSSLINALAGYTRSIVSPIPGTTRDVVTLHAAIDGWPVELTDTAGMHAATSDLEQQGIERAHGAVRRADLRIWLLDGSSSPMFPVSGENWLVVINKCDLQMGWDWQRLGDAPHISAQKSAGVAELCDLIAQTLVPRPPAAGEAVPCLAEQVQWLRAVAACKPRETASG